MRWKVFNQGWILLLRWLNFCVCCFVVPPASRRRRKTETKTNIKLFAVIINESSLSHAVYFLVSYQILWSFIHFSFSPGNNILHRMNEQNNYFDNLFMASVKLFLCSQLTPQGLGMLVGSHASFFLLSTRANNFSVFIRKLQARNWNACQTEFSFMLRETTGSCESCAGRNQTRKRFLGKILFTWCNQCFRFFLPHLFSSLHS